VAKRAAKIGEQEFCKMRLEFAYSKKLKWKHSMNGFTALEGLSM